MDKCKVVVVLSPSAGGSALSCLERCPTEGQMKRIGDIMRKVEPAGLLNARKRGSLDGWIMPSVYLLLYKGNGCRGMGSRDEYEFKVMPS